MSLVEVEQAGESLATLLQLLQCSINSLLLQGALPGLVQSYDTGSVSSPLVQQVL